MPGLDDQQAVERILVQGIECFHSRGMTGADWQLPYRIALQPPGDVRGNRLGQRQLTEPASAPATTTFDDEEWTW